MPAPQEIQPVPFGNYQLVERLAMGGMAEVFLAWAAGKERLVALKRILPSIAADDEFIAMFIDEAKIAGQLTHSNVAQIFDIGKIEGSYFIAMEYISGHDLRALWDRVRDQAEETGAPIRGLPFGIACHVVKKLSEGLDFAHRRRDVKGRPLGIIHRDVSPQNILISYDGDIKIIDFGIAKAANRIVKTQTGILKGKFAYMAPEQARGDPIDHRADIFAIGVVLYELLTGERAFKGETDFMLLEKVRRVEVIPPRVLRSDIPRELERIVMKALSKEARDRYAWASVLASDLDRFLSDQGTATSKEELSAYIRRTFSVEYAEENRRITTYKRQAGNSGSRSSGRVDGNGATVVRGGASAKNGFKNDGNPGDLLSRSTVLRAAAADSDSGDVDFDEVPAVDTNSDPRSAGKRKALNVNNTSDAELAPLRDQAPKVADFVAPPLSSSAVATAIGPTVQSIPGEAVSSSRSHRRESFSNLVSGHQVDVATEPLISAPAQLSMAEESVPRDSQNLIIVLACLLGAVLGAGLGAGLVLATRAPAPDTLVVTSPRQTEVKLNTVVLCAQTPCALHLGKGRYELLFQAPGAEAVTRVVDVGDGPAIVDVTLERTARGLRVETDPPGALVVLDDVALKEVTPTTLPPLSVGKQVQLVLTLEGFEPLSAVRTIQGDGVWRFDMPRPTTLHTVTSIPADALINAGAKEGAGAIVVVAGKKAISVKVSRPGCDSKILTLTGTGKAKAAQTVTLECRPFDGGLAIEAPRRPIAVKIDGVSLPKGLDLGAYRLPAGTWNVVLISPRGKRDARMVEVLRGVSTPLVSKVK